MNSTLSSGAPVVGSLYDIRGFKNWSSGDKFYGAYSGVIQIPVGYLSLTSFVINGGVSPINDVNVDSEIVYTGNPTEYMLIGDVVDSGAWKTFSNSTIPMELTSGDGVKNVSCKLRDVTTTISNSKSTSLEYIAPTAITVQIDVGRDSGNADYAMEAPWNNLGATAGSTIGIAIADMTDTNGASTGIGLEVVSVFAASYESNTIAVDGDPLNPYPYAAIRDVLKVTAGTVAIVKLTNMNPIKTYDFKFYARRGFVGATTLVNISGNEVEINHKDNAEIYTVWELNGIVPEVNGDVDISITGNTVSNSGFIGVIEFSEV